MSAITIQLPDSVFGKRKEVTDKDQRTPEQFALLAITEKFSSVITVEHLVERAKRVNLERFERLLAKVPCVKSEERISL